MRHVIYNPNALDLHMSVTLSWFWDPLLMRHVIYNPSTLDLHMSVTLSCFWDSLLMRHVIYNNPTALLFGFQGFTPFARVVRGMDTTVPRLHAGYGLLEEVSAGAFGTVNQGKAAAYGNEYLRAAFPKLSSIRSAALLDKR